jgi:diguanylate cyclase
MITSTLLLVLGGCVLGIVQLLAGIAIGIWLRRDDRAVDQANRQDMIQAGQIAKRLQALADEVSTSVGEHATHLEKASRTLTQDSARSKEDLAELVVDVIGDIVRANQSLQSKLETAESRLKEQAVEIEAHISRSLTDPLTGLANRREFNQRLAERMSAWSRRKEAFTLMLLDVDHFKRLNDQYGHVAGDRMLADLGRTLKTCVRREDVVARYGGEEFAVLLPATTLDPASRAANNVREAIAHTTIDHHGRPIRVTVSAGVATIQNKEAAESLVQRADAALYAAKAAGRNCVHVHDGTRCRAASTAATPQRPPNEHPPAAPTAAKASAPGRPIPAPPPTSADDMERDAISPGLAQTCEELRRFVADRDQKTLEMAPGPDV